MVEPNPSVRMMTFHIPDDPILKALGWVSVAHAHLDYILRMTFKTLAEVPIDDALAATEGEGSAVLRDRLRKLAKEALGEGAALIKFQAVLHRCRLATERRNALVHGVIGQDLEGGDAQMRMREGTWTTVPTAAELEQLAKVITNLWQEINGARLDGFIKEAMAARGKS
jgi:hypothetical protein